MHNDNFLPPRWQCKQHKNRSKNSREICKICKKYIYFSLSWCTFCLIMTEEMPSVWDCWLRIALILLMYATGVINPAVVKTGNESTVQIWRLTFGAFPSLLSYGSDAIRQFSFTRTTNNYSRMRHHSKNPHTWGWSWSTPLPYTTETKMDCISAVRGVAACWLHCPSPRPAQPSPAPWEISPEPLVAPVGKRTGQGTTSSLPPALGSHCGNLYSDLTPWGLQRTIWGLNHWLSMTEKQGGAQNNQHTDLSRPSSYLQCSVVIPASGFAYLENGDRDALWAGNLVGCRCAWFRYSKEKLCLPLSLFRPHPRKEKSHSLPAVESVFWSLLSRRAGHTPGSCVALGHLGKINHP